MKYFLGLLVIGILYQNSLANGLGNPILDDFERRLVRLESRQFVESENLEHRMLQLETHLGNQIEFSPERTQLEQTVEKPTNDTTILQRVEKLEESWLKKLKEHLEDVSAKHEDLSGRFSAIEKQVEEAKRKASLPQKKKEELEEQEFIPAESAKYEANAETGSGYGESEPEFGSGYDELESENEKFEKEKVQRIGSRLYFIENDESTKKTWPSAVAFCKQQNGRLVSLQDEDEWADLSVKGLNSKRSYWIDINDRATERKFISDSTGNTNPFLKWGRDEPSSSPGDEDCVELSSAMNHEMNDADCMSKNFYVCRLN